MGITDAISKKIKDSVPPEFQTAEQEIVDSAEDIAEYEAIPNHEKSAGTKEIENHISHIVKPNKEVSTVNKLNYVTGQIRESESQLKDAEAQLREISERVIEAKKNIEILKVIKSEKLKFDVIWLVNLIGELKSRGDGLEDLEKEVYSVIQDGINDNEFKRKK